MKKILSLLVPVLALVGGIAGGTILRPSGDSAEAAAHPPENAPATAPTETGESTAGHGEPDEAEASDHGSARDAAGEEAADAWFTFPSQFFVPMMRNGDMGAMIILTLSIETAAPELEAMGQQEHRLRDALLRQLMIHANTGGFDGNFTSEASMRVLRDGLLTSARSATTLPVKAVLIEDIARQGG